MLYIVILIWNGKKYLAKLFQSLADLNFPQEKLKIVVIDSNSIDGSREFVKNLGWPNLHLIKLGKNLGFVGGNNLGMQYALDHGAEYVVLLNQDTVVDKNFLNELFRVANSGDQIGVVQPLILYYQNPDEINSWGNELHYLGYGFSGGNHLKTQNVIFKAQNIKNITYASAAAVLYKVKMLKKIGLFDENIFAYHEDSDICLRAKLAGYKTVLAPRAIVYHDYQFPTSKNKQRYFWMEKNRLYLIFKFYKLKTLFLIWPIMVLMDGGQLIFALKNGYFWQWLKSRLWFLVNFKRFYGARRRAQKNRQINDKQLTKNFASQIKYQEVSNPLLDRIGNPIMRWYWRAVRRLI